jgi:Lipocalin-like domain
MSGSGHEEPSDFTVAAAASPLKAAAAFVGRGFRLSEVLPLPLPEGFCVAARSSKGSQISLALEVFSFHGRQHDAFLCSRRCRLLLSCAWMGSRAGHSETVGRQLEADFVVHSDRRWRRHRTIWSQSKRKGAHHARRIRCIRHRGGKSQASGEESAALLKTLMVYTGRFTIENDKFTTKVDISWNELLTGQDQVRFFELEGDKLTIRTAEQASAVYPGKKVVGTLTWERER